MTQIPEAIQSTIRIFLMNCTVRFPELDWDRCTYDPRIHILTVYGWFPYKLEYKDFLIIEIDCDPENKECPLFLSFVTSSVKYSSELHKFFGLKDETHRDCMALQPFLQGNPLPDQ